MVEQRELMTVCRQIGGMMEAGVDILRITRVLRAQTKNPRLLELYDSFDHDLRMGRSVADAMANAPDIFSPFAISLVRQGEERNTLAGAFLKVADFLQQEAPPGGNAPLGGDATPSGNAPACDAAAFGASPLGGMGAPFAAVAPESWFAHARALLVQILLAAALLLLALALLQFGAALQWLPARWLAPLSLLSGAACLAGAALWLRRGMTSAHRLNSTPHASQTAPHASQIAPHVGPARDAKSTSAGPDVAKQEHATGKSGGAGAWRTPPPEEENYE